MNEMTQSIKTVKKDLFSGRTFSLNMSINDILYILLCYAMSSCSFFEGRVPFVLSAYAAAFSGGRWLIAMLSCAAGLLGLNSGYSFTCYILVLAGATFLMGIVNGGRRFRAFCISALLLIVSFVQNAISDAYWIDYAFSILEAAFCFAGVYVFSDAVPLLTSAKERHCVLDTEVVSLFVLLALAVRCTVGLPLIAGMDLSVILAILILLAINMESDISLGTAMGVVFGFMTVGRALSSAVSMGAFAFAAFCCGVLNRFGKWGVVLGFVMANAALTALLKGETLPFDIFEVLCASVIFSALPKRVTGYISSITAKTVHTATKAFVHEEKIQSVISKKLSNLGSAYECLASAYDSCFKSDTMSKRYIIRMLDSASSKICPDCGLKYNCWERCYKDSYRAMVQMLETAEKSGNLTEEDVPEPIKGKCIKLKEFISHFNKMFGIYKVEKMWQDKLNDARKLVSEQLRSISRSVRDTADEFMMSVDTAAEKEIKTILDKNRIPFKEVTFLKGKDDTFSMEILLSDRQLTKKEENTVESIIEQTTGKRASLIDKHMEREGQVLIFKNCARYRVSVGSAAVCKHGEEVSGDSFISCVSPRGDFVAALSDGMGTGSAALAESRTATELLKNFVVSGMDIETSLELINSSLLLRSSEDNFATMDVCSIDLSKGNINLYKSGAATGFVKKGNNLIKIESDSLPFGILKDYGKTKTTSLDADKSAQVILMTDGVYDVFACTGASNLEDIILCSKTDNPQILASEIMNVALEQTISKALDDMSVCVINVWER